MADVNRDVTITVSIANGNMKLPGIDTSAFEASVKSLGQKLRDELKGSMGDVKFNELNVDPWRAAAKEVTSAVQQAANQFNAVRDSMTSTSGLGRVGYGQGVRDRANAEASTTMDQMVKSGTVSGSPAEISKMREQWAKEIEKQIRERDREQERSRRDEEQEDRRGRSTSNAMTAGAARAGRGAAMLSGVAGGDNEAMVRTTVAAHGMYDMFRGLESAGKAAGLALSGPLAVGIVAATGAAALMYARWQEGLHLMRVGGSADIARASARAAGFSAMSESRFHSGTSVANVSFMGREATNEAARSAAHAESRDTYGSMLHGTDNDPSMTMGQKGTIRQRFEEERDFNEQFGGLGDRKDSLTTRLNDLKGVESQLNKDRATRPQKTQEALAKVRIARQKEEDNPDRAPKGWGKGTGNTWWDNVSEMVSPGSATGRGGKVPDRPEYRSPAQRQRMEELKEGGSDEQKIHTEAGAAHNKSTQDLAANKREQLSVEREIMQVLAEQHKSIRQYQEEAWRTVQIEKERAKQHEIATGSADPGDINRRLMIQSKTEENERIRQKNLSDGRDEFAGTKPLSPEERRIAMASGDESGVWAEQESQREFKKLGLKRRGKNDLKEAEDEFEARKKLDPAADAAKKGMADQAGKVAVSAQSAKDMAKESGIADAVAEGLKMILAQLKIDLDQKFQELKSYFPRQ